MSSEINVERYRLRKVLIACQGENLFVELRCRDVDVCTCGSGGKALKVLIVETYPHCIEGRNRDAVVGLRRGQHDILRMLKIVGIIEGIPRHVKREALHVVGIEGWIAVTILGAGAEGHAHCHKHQQ